MDCRGRQNPGNGTLSARTYAEEHSGQNMGSASHTDWVGGLVEARTGSEVGQEGARSLLGQGTVSHSWMGAVLEEAHIHWGCVSEVWMVVVRAEEDTRLHGLGGGGGG